MDVYIANDLNFHTFDVFQFTGTIQTKDKLLEFASLGCYSEFDLFGIETTHYQQVEEIDMPGDATRIQWIKWLVDAGYEEKITIAHDIHTKHRLVSIVTG